MPPFAVPADDQTLTLPLLQVSAPTIGIEQLSKRAGFAQDNVVGPVIITFANGYFRALASQQPAHHHMHLASWQLHGQGSAHSAAPAEKELPTWPN